MRNLNSSKFLQSQAEQPIFNFLVQFFSSAQNLKPAAIISAKFENDVAPSSVSTPNKSCPFKKILSAMRNEERRKFFINLRRRIILKIRVERRRLLIWRAGYYPNATACEAYCNIIASDYMICGTYTICPINSANNAGRTLTTAKVPTEKQK